MLWDPVRALWVDPTPEEKVRQRWIRRMIDELGYPKNLLAVEKDLSSLAARRLAVDPHRRIDLLCYTPSQEGLRPLILIECKAEAIDAAAERQALGYNDAIGAPFVCLISSNEAKTLWREQGKIFFVPFLPTYKQLVER